MRNFFFTTNNLFLNKWNIYYSTKVYSLSNPTEKNADSNRLRAGECLVHIEDFKRQTSWNWMDQIHLPRDIIGLNRKFITISVWNSIKSSWMCAQHFFLLDAFPILSMCIVQCACFTWILIAISMANIETFQVHFT